MTIRGKVVHFDSEVINDAYRLPNADKRLFDEIDYALCSWLVA